MKYDSSGYLEIAAFTAGGALPTPNVNIRITGSEEGNIGVYYSLITDRDGKTPPLPLPAPSVEYSLSPDPDEQPYANYTVEAYGKGFYPKRLQDVSIFSGIKSVLPIEMIPNGDFEKNVYPPKSSNDSIIYENEDL